MVENANGNTPQQAQKQYIAIDAELASSWLAFSINGGSDDHRRLIGEKLQIQAGSNILGQIIAPIVEAAKVEAVEAYKAEVARNDDATKNIDRALKTGVRPEDLEAGNFNINQTGGTNTQRTVRKPAHKLHVSKA